MKKLFFYVFAAVLAVSCAKDPPVSPQAQEQQEPQVIELQTRSGLVEAAVYDATLDVWMAPNPAPQPFSSGTPTHYQLKIYPKTEAEQWEVETMEDVRVQYIPFGYLQLTEDERVKVASTEVHSDIIEVSPYTITYTDYESTDGGPTGPVTFQLPILYATWPMEKPLPEGMEYVVENEIHIPEPLITRAVPGDQIINLNYPLTGRILDYDDQVGGNIPLAGIRIDVAGYNQDSFITDGYGGFLFWISLPRLHVTPTIVSTTVTITYNNPTNKWKISGSNSLAPLMKVLAVTFRADNNDNPIPTEIVMPESSFYVSEIHRAANYFFQRQTDLPKYSPTSGITIIAHDGIAPGQPGLRGVYNFPPNRTPWIDIYNSPEFRNSDLKRSPVVVGTTLHELGHMTHHQYSPTNIENTDVRIVESFAPYVGWYIGEQYYRSIGWTKSSSSQDITDQARQGWMETLSGPYSPLFIDLTDNHHQWVITDRVSGLPASAVWSIVTQSRNWAQCRPKIESYVGQYYSQSDLDMFLDHYDYWFGRPLN